MSVLLGSVLFIAVPKTAGTSIATILRNHGGKGFGHTTVYEYPDLDKLFKFAFVRNPWDRFVSAYNHICPQKDFREVCLNPPSEIHFKPMYHFIDSVMDFVGRFESLEEDWAKVSEIIGIKDRLPHYRKYPHLDYRAYYTPETWDAVARYYAKDIEAFEYLQCQRATA